MNRAFIALKSITVVAVIEVTMWFTYPHIKVQQKYSGGGGETVKESSEPNRFFTLYTYF